MLLTAFFVSVGFFSPAYSQKDFYAGKTITLIATTGPGGTADFRIKAMIPFLRKHIPGNQRS
jgi:tripartite-type tricarboxylate transporter receptor subunit TctC